MSQELEAAKQFARSRIAVLQDFIRQIETLQDMNGNLVNVPKVQKAAPGLVSSPSTTETHTIKGKLLWAIDTIDSDVFTLKELGDLLSDHFDFDLDDQSGRSLMSRFVKSGIVVREARGIYRRHAKSTPATKPEGLSRIEKVTV